VSLEVVGVVGDVKQFGLDGPTTDDLYVPLAQMPPSQASAVAARMYWIVRTNDDPRSHASALREIVRSVDPDVATSSVETLDEILERISPFDARSYVFAGGWLLAVAYLAISNCTLSSSLTLTVPPATLIGVMPKSRCLMTASPRYRAPVRATGKVMDRVCP